MNPVAPVMTARMVVSLRPALLTPSLARSGPARNYGPPRRGGRGISLFATEATATGRFVANKILDQAPLPYGRVMISRLWPSGSSKYRPRPPS